MRKLLLSVFFLMLASSMLAQVTLDPNQFVNVQIASDTLSDGSHDPAKTVYKAESGQFYAFDGTLNCDFDLTIIGPDNGWIMHEANPPAFLQIPAADGSARDMIHILAGGSTRIKNVLIDGNLQNGELVGAFVVNSGGTKVIFDNCALADCLNFTSRNQASADSITYTNCVIINLVRKAATPFNGIFTRIDAAVKHLTIENNTIVNSSRLLGNGGQFFTSTLHEIHNSFINQQVNGHELHWYEGIQANNIFYNWSYRGRKATTNGYEEWFTTWEYHYTVSNKLDSVSLYNGKNLFYRDPAIQNYYHTDLGDSVMPCVLWNYYVDSTINADNNFKIGKNYWQFDPMFTNNPTKLDSMLAWVKYHWTNGPTWPDWRIQVAVSYDDQGQPVLNWPQNWDLSYANDTLLTGGTDGLPLGDLNWFPNALATYQANEAQYTAALQDSIANATSLYVPHDTLSALIQSGDITGIKTYSSNVPNQYYLSNNYPNPFNPSTTIRFGLPEQSDVTLTIFNILGQKVFEETAKSLAAGEHLLNFNASRLSSGIYIYSINATSASGKNFVESKKMMLLK
jgi:Secretion system C-terminal sorting domain